MIVTESTAGNFVTKDEKVIIARKEELLAAKTEAFLKSLKTYGITKEQLIDHLKGEKADE